MTRSSQVAEFNWASPSNNMTPLSKKKVREYVALTEHRPTLVTVDEQDASLDEGTVLWPPLQLNGAFAGVSIS
jgi:hypothetical protein